MFHRIVHRLSSASVLALFFASCQEAPLTPDLGGGPPKAHQQYSAPSNIFVVGDSLDVFVMEDDKFNGTYKVRENGDIILPKVGRVRVSGLTSSSAQDAISQVLQSSQLSKASVIVERSSKSTTQSFDEKPKMLIFVTGAVNQPGQHMLAMSDSTSFSAYEAILIAGGTNAFADERKAYILRRGAGNTRTRIPLNIRDIRNGHGNDIPLREGDMITVPERSFGLNL